MGHQARLFVKLPINLVHKDYAQLIDATLFSSR